MHVHVKFN